MTRWAEGEEKVERLLIDGELEQVQPSAAAAERLLAEARRHLGSAAAVSAADPAGAFDLLYAAARKSMAALLSAQGLRATSRGGHVAVQTAVTAQLGRVGGVVRPFGRLRRTRNDADYPRVDSPELSAADVEDDLPKAAAIVEAMTRMVPRVDPW